ncbi:MAG: tandem-95 repeat protein [Ekhidna sp.]|nr:tandem-95 repeat protein [Ekhidna sp.]
MIKQIAIILQLLIVASLLGSNAYAQSCSINTNVNGIAGTGFTNASVAQSFTACESGLLSSVSAQSGNAPAGLNEVIVEIYNGDGLSGTKLLTSGGVFVNRNRTVTWDLSSFGVQVVAGQKYTARFTTLRGSPQLAYGTGQNAAIDYYTGGRIYILGNSWNDMFFSANIQTLSDPVKTPADDATEVARNSDVKLTFTRTMEAVSGNITIENVTDATSQDVDVTTLTIEGGDVFMPFPKPLMPGKEYSIVVPSGAIKASVNIPYTGLAAGEWNFTTSTRPYGVLTTTSEDLTNNAVIPFTLNFSDDVTGFELSDLLITNGVASNLGGSSSTYSFDVSPTADGNVVVVLPANVVEAGASNGNDSTGYELVFDGTAPSVALNTSASETLSSAIFDIEVVFSEPVQGFDTSDLVVTNAVILSSSSMLDSLYTVSLRAQSEGQITVDLGADVATDLAGNSNSAAPAIIDLTYSVDLETNLLSFYPFEATAEDTVSTGFDGTVTGALLTSGFDGAENTAYAFDGNDQITFGDVSIGAGSFTVAFWVKIPQGLTADRAYTLLGKREACSEGRFFEINYTNSSSLGHRISVEQRDNGGLAAPQALLSQVGEWIHITYVKDNDSQESSFYINAQQQTPVNWTRSYNFENNGNLRAGISACNGNGRFMFIGDMDNLHVYGRALTSVEVDLLVPFAVRNTSIASGSDIQAGQAIDITLNKNIVASSVNTTNIAAAGSTSGPVSLTVSTSNDKLTIAPTAGWPVNEDITVSLSGILATNGTTLPNVEFTYSIVSDQDAGMILHYPISGNVTEALGDIADQDGTISGALFAEGIDGDPFGALSFDGTDDVVTLGDAPISDKSFSFSLWVKVPGDGSENANTIILSKREACSEGRMFNLYYNRSGDKVRFIGSTRSNASNGSVATGYNFPVDEWVNVAFIMDTEAKQKRLIVNGVLEGESAWVLSSANLENSARIRLGATPCNGVNGELRYDGLIDDFRIYDRVLEPRVTSIAPTSGAEGVSNDTVITVSFDRSVDVSSFSTDKVSISDKSLNLYAFSAAFSNGDSVLTITPDNSLPKGKLLTVSIDTLAAVIGSSFLPFQTSFTIVRSQLLSFSPANGTVNTDSVQTINFKFDNTMDMNSLVAGIRIVGSMHGSVEGEFSMPEGDSVVFTPSTPYFPNELITVYLVDELLDEGGESISNTQVFSFHAKSSQFTGATLSYEFSQLSVSGTTGSPRVLVAGDIDNDGDLDLIGGDDSSRRLLLFENIGSGNYSAAESIASGKGYFDVKVVDFDFDGDMDILTLDRAVAQGLYWHENDGSGSFTERTIKALTNTDSRSISIGDFNDDGQLDVAVASYGSSRLSVYEQDGTELYGAANAGQPIFVNHADLDNDGDLDIISARYGGTVAQWLNDGQGNFTGSTLLSVAQARSVIPMDMDQDGDIDIVYTGQSASQIGVLENDGAGNFTNVQVGSVGGPHRIDVGDADGDGDFDIVYTVASGSNDINFYYLENSGSLTLWVPRKLVDGETFTGTFTQTANFADIDQDGDLDVLATDASTGFYVYENQIIDRNAAPLVTGPLADQTLVEDDPNGLTLDISGVFTDSEGDAFSITASVDTAAISTTISNDDLIISLDQENFNGQAIITLIADDGNGTNSDVIILTVSAENDAPLFELSTSEITVDEDFTTVESITATLNQPEDEDAPIYSLSPSTVAFASVTIDENSGQVTIESIADGFGTQEFTITADDGAATNNIATQTFTLNVSEVNDAPVLDAPIADLSVEEDATSIQDVDVAAAFSDADGDDLIYSFDVITGSDLASLSLVDGALAITLEPNAFGTIQVEVSAEDVVGELAVDQFDIIVTPVNDAPLFTISGDLTAPKNFTEALILMVSPEEVPFGEDTQVVSYSISPASVIFADVSIDGATGEVTVTAVADQFGSQEFTITADDGETTNNTFSQVFTLTIVDNLPPEVVATVSDTNLDEDAATLAVVDVTTLFTDPESDPLTYAVTDDFEGGITSTLNGNVLEVTPLADFNGSGLVTITASDANQSASTSFTLTVNAVNDAPVASLSIENQQATEDAVFAYSLDAGLFTDVDGDVITITLNGAPAWVSFDGVTFSGTPANSDVGSSTIEVIGTDSNGESATTSFVLAVANVNDAPEILSAIADVVVDEDAETSVFDLSQVFGDVDAEDVLTFNASSSATSLLSVELVNQELQVAYIANAFGSGSVLVTATDASGANITDEFLVTVNAVNDAPVVALSIENQIASEDVAFTYILDAGLFTDVDGDAITISANGAPDWLSFDGSSFTGTPENGDVGTVEIELVGNDGNGGAAATSFSVSVTNVNDAPIVVQAVEDITVDEDAAAISIDLSGVFQDPDAGDALNLSITSEASEILTATLSDQTMGINFTADASGVATISVTATDPAGLTVTDEFNVTINAVNDAPVFTLSQDEIIAEQNFAGTLSIDILSEAVPADEQSQTVTYSTSSTDDAVVSATINGSTIELVAISDAFGTQTFDVIADDGQAENNTHVMSFVVTVSRALSVSEGLGSKILIYPNPVMDFMTIEGKTQVDITIYSLEGRQVMKLEKANGKVDVSRLETGVYMMEITSDKERITKRIIKAN